MEKKKILKTLVGMGLAVAIAFTSVPQTASAASYSVSKLNTSAHAGSTYTIKTYFPGIGFQKMKVRFDSITKDFYYPSLYGNKYKKAEVKLHCSLPSSTQKKIKKNTVKMVRSSKLSRWSTSLLCGTYCIDATTGTIAKGLYSGSSAYATNSNSKTFRQRSGNFRASYTVTTSFDYDVTLIYDAFNEGNYLVGVAGTNKEVTTTNSKVTKFTNGDAPITSSAFYKKKMKKLSIWTRV